MSGFDALWLAQREPFDLAARSSALEQRFAEAMRAHSRGHSGAVRVLDLGGGTAANFRALAPRLGGDQHWLLCDHDPQLLSAAQRSIAQWAIDQGWECSRSTGAVVVRTGAERWSLETRDIDLADELESIDAASFDGVSTTAFLDLVSRDWLERLASWIERSERPLLATLTVDGRRRWTPALESDAWIDDTFRHHQAGDKGFGLSLGPQAAQTLADIFRARNVPCETEVSDWRIGSDAPAMLRRMAAEAAAVASEVEPSRGADIEAWRVERDRLIAQGRASLTVGHIDLLARPGETSTG